MTLQFTSPSSTSTSAPALPHDSCAPLRLGFLSPHNPFDRGSFSGTPYFAARALAARPDIDLRVLGPHRAPGRIGRLKARLLHQKSPEPDVKRLDLSGVDVVLGLVASPLLDQLQDLHEIPCLHVTDATPRFLREFYGWDVAAKVDALEKRLSRRAAATVYSSDYMVRRARREMDGGMNALCIPFGINLETLPETCPRKTLDGPVELLFVCSDWVRKGGDTALAMLDALGDQGIDARLTIVGRVPDAWRGHPSVTSTGFLDKNNPADAARLTELYRSAHLMLLPTRGDCTPMVVAEALAFGTPVLASNVGGMPTLLAPGTGALLDLSASTADWVQATQSLLADPVTYAETSQRAFSHARNNLTWDSWAWNVTQLARGLCVTELAA